MFKAKKISMFMNVIAIITYQCIYNFPSFADSEKKPFSDILKKIDKANEEGNIKKDRFYQCWFDNIKPNSTESHTNVVAIYCSNKTGYKLP